MMGYGDDLMVTGEARELRRRDPRKVAARHPKGGFRRTPIFDRNPNMATPAEIAAGDVQWLDKDAGRRYRAVGPKGVTWTDVGPTRGDLYFSAEEIAFARRAEIDGAIIIEPAIKPLASPNKDWGFDNWRRLVALAPDLPWLQLVGPDTGARRLGVPGIEPPSFRHAAAVLGLRARAAVLPEGGLHHAAAAVGCPAVVIFGGFISPKQTGYPGHRNIFTGGVPCAARRPCDHCRAAMVAITPEMVLADLRVLLAETRQSEAVTA